MRNPKFHELLKKMADMHDKKNADYGSDEDCLSNLKGCERLGIHPAMGTVVRLQDKWSRIENFFKKNKLKNESVYDSLLDNAIYSLLAIQIIEEYENPKKEKTGKYR
jgi:hypothetical protein